MQTDHLPVTSGQLAALLLAPRTHDADPCPATDPPIQSAIV